MRITFSVGIIAVALLSASSATAQRPQYNPDHDPVRIKHQDSRQYRSEPKGNASKRNTRCKIIVRKGQDKRVCGQPTNYAAPKR